MELQLIPVDSDGQRVDLNPSAIKDMDNITLTEFLAQAKIIADLYKKGETKSSILAKIDKYPISKSLKRKLREEVEKL